MRVARLSRFHAPIYAAAFAMSGGCATIRTAPAVPIPMHLTAKTEFLLHQPAGADQQAGTQCALLSADIEVESVRGDTLFVRRLLRVVQPRGVSSCRGEGAGFVVASATPTLRAQTGRGSQAGTLTAIVIGTSILVFSVVMLSYVLSGPGA